MDCLVTPLKTLMGFSVYLNVQLKFYNLPYSKVKSGSILYPNIHLAISFAISSTDSRSSFSNHDLMTATLP